MFAGLTVSVGALLIAIAMFDIIATVLHPEVESPLSTRFQRFIWRLLRLCERLFPRRGNTCIILNWGLPLMVAGLIGLWLLLLLIGFALIYYPWIGDPAFFASSAPSNRSLFTAFYYSGVTLATLGYGDIQPLALPLRFLAVAQALSGAVTVSAGVAYVLAVYPALSRRRTVATALDAEVAGRSDALPMIERYLGGERHWSDDMAEQLRNLGLELLKITENHETHPVLYYAHPRRVQHSFVRILVIAQSLVGLLRYGLSPQQHREIVYCPHLLLLEQSLHYSLRILSESLHIPPIEEVNEADERERLMAEYTRICTNLERLGLTSSRFNVEGAVPVLIDSEIEGEANGKYATTPTHHDDNIVRHGQSAALDPALDLSSDSPSNAFLVFRLQTDPWITAYAASNGYSIAVARADYESTWWVGQRR